MKKKGPGRFCYKVKKRVRGWRQMWGQGPGVYGVFLTMGRPQGRGVDDTSRAGSAAERGTQTGSGLEALGGPNTRASLGPYPPHPCSVPTALEVSASPQALGGGQQ